MKTKGNKMGRFINPFTDMGFKLIFGQEVSKPILIEFLNGLLVNERKIKDLKFLDKEQLGATDEDRSLIYDVYCELEDGEHIIVEMQYKSQPYFKNRSIYYASKAIVNQGEKGAGWHYDINSVYLIAFLNFKLEDISKAFRTDIALMDREEKTLFSDKIRLIYLQLPLFNKEPDECEDVFDRFIYVLKHMDILERMPWAAQNSVFQKLASIAEVAALSKEDRKRYDESLRKFRDTIGVMEGQRAEGKAEGKAEVALNLKSMGMCIEDIAKATGLSIEVIQSL